MIENSYHLITFRISIRITNLELRMLFVKLTSKKTLKYKWYDFECFSWKTLLFAHTSNQICDSKNGARVLTPHAT